MDVGRWWRNGRDWWSSARQRRTVEKYPNASATTEHFDGFIYYTALWTPIYIPRAWLPGCRFFAAGHRKSNNLFPIWQYGECATKISRGINLIFSWQNEQQRVLWHHHHQLHQWMTLWCTHNPWTYTNTEKLCTRIPRCREQSVKILNKLSGWVSDLLDSWSVGRKPPRDPH